MFGKQINGIGRRLISATFGVSMAVAVATTPASAATWKYHQLDSDRFWDAVTLDANYNGNYDNIWFDLDDDGRWDTHVYNTKNSDALLEVLTFDRDEDGILEYMVLDTNQLEGFELAYINLNDDGVWDGIVPFNSTGPLNRQAQNYINNSTGSTLVQIFQLY